MSEYDDKMKALRAELPQGSTVDKRSKKDQELFKRLGSSVAYPTSDAATGVTEKPSDLGEVAYPQTDPMYAEETLIKKMAKATDDGKNKPTSSVTNAGKAPSGAIPTSTIKHKRSNYAPHKGRKKRGPQGPTPPKLDTIENYIDKQTEEYFKVAKGVIPPEHYEDFTQDEEAQLNFGEDAALKSFQAKWSNEDEDFKTQIKTLPNGEQIDLVIFDDGSQYYVYPDAKLDNLKPSDVIRIEGPKNKR